MAKDGTVRGGARIGAGKKKKSLDSKILEGKKATVLPTAEFEAVELEPADVGAAADMPPVSEFLKAKQTDGTVLQAPDIYRRTYEWLKTVGCHKLVSKTLIEQYAMMYARYVHCEEAVSRYGYLAKHPTTGNPIPSPYVSMGQNFAKQANIAWMQIYQIVKENASESFFGNPDDEMEKLLRKKG